MEIENVVSTLRFETEDSLLHFSKYSLRFSSGLNNSSTFDGTVVFSRDTITSRIVSMTVTNDVVHVMRSFDDISLQRTQILLN